MAKQLTVGPDGEFLAKGVNGQLLVKPDRVVIIRKGMLSLMTQGLKGDKEITGRWVITGCRDTSAAAGAKT